MGQAKKQTNKTSLSISTLSFALWGNVNIKKLHLISKPTIAQL